jgi:tetratricopeptide (TPR) repeat protein
MEPIQSRLITGEYSIDRIKVAGNVDLLTILPNNITNEVELAPVRAALKNTSDFSTRYPKSAPFLENYISTLAVHVDSFEQGSRRLGGQWVDKKTIEEMARVETEKVAEAKRVEEKRVAEIARLEQLRVAEIERVAHLESVEAARIKSLRSKSIDLQSQAITALQKGDTNSAVALMNQASKLSSSPSVEAYAKGIELFVKLIADKSLTTIDTNWQRPTFPDVVIYQEIFELLNSLSKIEKQDIHPDLVSLPEGLQAAHLLVSFSEDCGSKNGGGHERPISAIRKLRKSENYLKLRDADTFFAKPFIARLTAIDSLISPKFVEYEAHVTAANKLVEEKRFQEATSKYRAALELEPSEELERAIQVCEEKTTGF